MNYNFINQKRKILKKYKMNWNKNYNIRINK